ncbi:hypothetical protein [Azohydromonas lata]|uniref:Uncharacterized protein n=1 Tax=Azohydromonas lata TaxID=45677 RepID=A0ABU5IAF1_9BURK|nr:hypothetical protein [Azohydromonas lata]MDZ5456077.1 hypothetical protein [Azohydromonas lata]
MFAFDPHTELHVAALRCLAIVEFIGKPTLPQNKLTITKAAIFDAALKNPNVTRKILNNLAPERMHKELLRQVLYPDDVEYGEPVSTREIAAVAALLVKFDMIKIAHVEGDFYLMPKETLKIDFSRLPGSWTISLKALKPLTSKSLGTLQKAAFQDEPYYEE